MINYKSILLYSALALPVAFAGMPLYIHSPDFYATEYNISLAKLGVILFVLRAIDAVQDPIIGALSDKYSSKKNFIVLIASILLVASFYFLFNPLVSLVSNPLIWFIAMLFIATSSYSAITINLNSYAATWSDSSKEKNNIVSMREVFAVIGLICAISLPSFLQESGYSKAGSFEILSVILLIITAIGLVCFLIWAKRVKLGSKFSKNLGENFFANLKKIPKNVKGLYLVYFISVLASSMPAVLILFFVRDLLVLEAYTGLFLVSYFASGIIGVAIWKFISNKKSSEFAWVVSMIFAVAIFFWAYFLKAGDFYQFLSICILSGIAFGADLVLPHIILADKIQAQKHQSKSSFYYSILAFLMKFAFAIAAAISLPILEYAGFEAAAKNSSESLLVLATLYSLMPCFIKIISSLILWRQINENKKLNNNGRTNYVARLHTQNRSIQRTRA